MKYVIVRSNRLNTFGRDVDADNVVVMNMFRETKGILTFMKEILLKLRWKIPNCFFNPNLKNLDADLIIVFDGHARAAFLTWLKNNNMGRRLIFWCWNTVNEIKQNFSLNEIPKEYEIWSYSEHDCKEYGFSYNTTFYWKNYKLDIKDAKEKYDVYFVGKNKGRMKKLLNLKDELSKDGINCLFQIMPNHKWERNKQYSRPIPYSNVLDNIRSSKAIMDIRVNSTAGPSLRALEAAYYGKKLITDDSNVRHFKFYSTSNILILRGGGMGHLI